MPNFAPRWTLLALALISLNACGTANYNPACVCPPIKEYSREFQEKLAKEIDVAPENGAYPQAILDYALLREQLASCLKKDNF
jgi:hypothetical protein